MGSYHIVLYRMRWRSDPSCCHLCVHREKHHQAANEPDIQRRISVSHIYGYIIDLVVCISGTVYIPAQCAYEISNSGAHGWMGKARQHPVGIRHINGYGHILIQPVTFVSNSPLKNIDIIGNGLRETAYGFLASKLQSNKLYHSTYEHTSVLQLCRKRE